MPRVLLAALLLGLATAAMAAGPPAEALLLVASEDLPDPRFAQTVVLVVRDEGLPGPVGVILNRPSRVTLAKAFPDVKALAASEDRVHVGGPVALERLAVVFRSPVAPPDATLVADGIYLSWSEERLGELLRRSEPAAGLRVFIGHAGWAPGQLEGEVARGFWRAARPDAHAIFEMKPEHLWPELSRRTSTTTARLGTVPGNPQGGMP